MRKKHSLKPPIIIITGRVQEGKTSFAGRIIRNLKEKNFRIAGFLATGVHENGKRIGYNLFDIETLKEIELSNNIGNEQHLKVGRYYFNPPGMMRGLEILKPGNLTDKQLIVVDEIGPLELDDQGWSHSVEELIRTTSIPQLWIVRSGLVESVVKKWNVKDFHLFDVACSTVEEVTGKLIEIMLKKKGLD